MATFVAVHGAWVGGWYWRQVARLLRAAGHEAFTPTLTGLGERVHLVDPKVDLATHVEDIANVLRYEDLRDVVLVGHSYGGMMITGVAERVPERLARLVYLDAFVPGDGQALADLIPPDALEWFVERAGTMGAGWRIPHDPPDEDRRTDFTLAALLQPLVVRSAEAAELPRAYVACLESRDVPLFAHFADAATRARREGWTYRKLPTDHMPMETMPNELAETLLSFA